MSIWLPPRDLALMVSVDVYESIGISSANYFLQPQVEYRVSAHHDFEFERAKGEIREIAKLESNWDGYGAAPIQNQTKQNALEAADLIFGTAPIPEIAPNPNGTISMEWESEAGIAQLEIGLSRWSFFIERKGGAPILEDGPANRILPQLGLLVSANLFPALPATTTSTTIESNVQPADPRSEL